jgi:exopolyphosphatase / guanosine-5'-triphosphate,3'-diphosphate pyrophosphatase
MFYTAVAMALRCIKSSGPFHSIAGYNHHISSERTHLMFWKQLQPAPAPAPSTTKRIAIIDMGSNSFRLIVMEYVTDTSFKLVDEIREVVRLSEGMSDHENALSEHAIARALRAAHLYADFCHASGITQIIAVGTSAIRDATNAHVLLERIQTETKIQVRVLSGEEEAYYGYLSAVNSTTLQDGYVFDMGGGSVQIMCVGARQLLDAVSFPFGAVRMTEQFLHSNPAKAKEIDKLQEHVGKAFNKLRWFAKSGHGHFVALGGNTRLLARLIQKQTDYPLDELHGYIFTVQQLDAIIKTLAEMTIQERRRLAGMKEDRADIVLAGALVLREAVRIGGFELIIVSSQSLREGLFYEHFLANKAVPARRTVPAKPPLLENVRRDSVLNLANIYRFNQKHAEHIAHLTQSMFNQLVGRRICGDEARDWLWAAAMLHDIGASVDYNDHHKHSWYLITNAGLPGYTHREVQMIALMARYHRKGDPIIDAPLQKIMHQHDDQRLRELSALLRLAEFLDRARDGAVSDVRLRFEGDHAEMLLYAADQSADARQAVRVALWSAQGQTDTFEKAFQVPLKLLSEDEFA